MSGGRNHLEGEDQHERVFTIQIKKVSRHLDHLSSDELISTYRCMIDYSLLPPDEGSAKLPTTSILIVDSPADKSLSHEVRTAVRLRYSGARHLEFADAGHLSNITAMERYVVEIRRFLS